MKTCKIDTEKITSFKITNNIFFSANSAFLFCTDYETEMMIKKQKNKLWKIHNNFSYDEDGETKMNTNRCILYIYCFF